MQIILLFQYVLAQQNCAVKVLGDPTKGYDGFCWDLAANAKIDIPTLNKLNHFNCEKDGQAGQRLCVTPGVLSQIPDPPAKPDGTCNFVEVASGNTCDSISKQKHITINQLVKFNKDRGITCKQGDFLKLGARLCVSLGKYPSRAPIQNDPNRTCHYQITDPNRFFNCDVIAAAFDITVAQIDQWNQNTWQFRGCSKGLEANQKICVSQGKPVPPPKLAPDQVQCGAQHPDSTKFECPLKACCSKSGWCGTTPEFCTKVDGPPGLGCQSNCEVGVPAAAKVCQDVMQKTVGYYESWAAGRESGCNPLNPEDIDVSKWTHIHYSFAIVTEDGRLDMTDETERARLRKFKSLKVKKQSIKLIISVGGWAFNDRGTSHRFTQMVATQASRRKFIQSAIDFLNLYGLDGLDIDWEYPSADDRGGRSQDGANFLALVKELRETPAFGAFGLSIATPASYWYLRGFKIAEMTAYLDYIVYMTYDLHGNWDYNSSSEKGRKLMAHNNWEEVEVALKLIQRAGVPSNKILLGTGYYGHSFKLADPNCNSMRDCEYQDPGHDFSNVATPGRCTKAGGILSLFEINEIINEQGLEPTYDQHAVSKVLVYNQGTEWIGYDDSETIAVRSNLGRELCLGGLVVWALDLDDGSMTSMENDSSENGYLPFSEALNQFQNQMGNAYNLDRGMIADDFFDKVADASNKVFQSNYMPQMDIHRLMLAAITKVLSNIVNFISGRMNTQVDGHAKEISDRLLDYQTMGEGKIFYDCYQGSNLVQCPSLSGNWVDERLSVGNPGQGYEWRLRDANGLQSAITTKFKIDWNLLVVKEVYLKYAIGNSCKGFESLSCWEYKQTGLRILDPSLERNIFSQSAVNLYDDYIKKGVQDKIVDFMMKNIALFNCPDSCNFNSNLILTPKVPEADIFAKASNETGMPTDAFMFGPYEHQKTTCVTRLKDYEDCHTDTYTWDGSVKLKDGYPPKMKDEIDKFIKDQKELVNTLTEKYMSDNLSADEAALYTQTSIFFLGSAQEFVENVKNYEDTVIGLEQEEEEKNHAISEFIISFLITEVATTIVTAGVGAVVAGVTAAIANSVKFASFSTKLGSRISDLVTSANNLKLVKGLRKISAELKTMYKNSSPTVQKLGAKLHKGIEKTKEAIKCHLLPRVLNMGVGALISAATSKRSLDSHRYFDSIFENITLTTSVDKRGEVLWGSIRPKPFHPEDCLLTKKDLNARPDLELTYNRNCKGSLVVDIFGSLTPKPADFNSKNYVCDHIIELNELKMKYFDPLRDWVRGLDQKLWPAICTAFQEPELTNEEQRSLTREERAAINEKPGRDILRYWNGDYPENSYKNVINVASNIEKVKGGVIRVTNGYESFSLAEIKGGLTAVPAALKGTENYMGSELYQTALANAKNKIRDIHGRFETALLERQIPITDLDGERLRFSENFEEYTEFRKQSYKPVLKIVEKEFHQTPTNLRKIDQAKFQSCRFCP